MTCGSPAQSARNLSYGDERMTSSLYVDPRIPRFTRQEFVREMNERFGFSDGTFRRYQELGLVAAPRRSWTPGRQGSIHLVVFVGPKNNAARLAKSKGDMSFPNAVVRCRRDSPARDNLAQLIGIAGSSENRHAY